MGCSEFMIKPWYKSQFNKIKNMLDSEYKKEEELFGNVITTSISKKRFRDTQIYKGDKLICVSNDRHNLTTLNAVRKKYPFEIYELDSLLGLGMNGYINKYRDCFDDLDYDGPYRSDNDKEEDAKFQADLLKMVANMRTSSTSAGESQTCSDNVSE